VLTTAVVKALAGAAVAVVRCDVGGLADPIVVAYRRALILQSRDDSRLRQVARYRLIVTSAATAVGLRVGVARHHRDGAEAKAYGKSKLKESHWTSLPGWFVRTP
jgi:hypothetical protein